MMSPDGFHLVFFFSFDELARQEDKIGAELRSFLIGGEERSVEDTMHLPSRREVEAVGIGGDNLRDLEQAFSLRGQFSGEDVDPQVSGV